MLRIIVSKHLEGHGGFSSKNLRRVFVGYHTVSGRILLSGKWAGHSHDSHGPLFPRSWGSCVHIFGRLAGELSWDVDRVGHGKWFDHPKPVEQLPAMQ